MDDRKLKFKSHMMLGILTVIALLFGLAILYYKNNSYTPSSYSDINSFKQHNLDIEIPKFIDQEENILITNNLGMIQINNDRFVLKIAQFIDYNADTLGLYEKASIDNRYTVSDNSITYFRYRLKYPGYEGATLINWCTNTKSYGLMIDYEVTEDFALNLIGLTSDDIVKYIPNNNTISNNNEINDMINCTLNDTLTIKIPKFKNKVNIQNLENTYIFSMDNKNVFAIVLNKHNNNFTGQGEKDLGNNIALRYLNINPFNIDDIYYEDYNTFLNNIENIKVLQ